MFISTDMCNVWSITVYNNSKHLINKLSYFLNLSISIIIKIG